MAHPTSKALMNACEESIKKENIDYQRVEHMLLWKDLSFQHWRNLIYIDHGRQM